MSKDINDIFREITKQNKELHSIDDQISKEVVKDIFEIKKSIKNIDLKISAMQKVLEELFEVITTITIFIDEAEEIGDSEDLDDEEDWTPYDDRNFIHDKEDDSEDDSEDEWSSGRDES